MGETGGTGKWGDYLGNYWGRVNWAFAFSYSRLHSSPHGCWSCFTSRCFFPDCPFFMPLAALLLLLFGALSCPSALHLLVCHFFPPSISGMAFRFRASYLPPPPRPLHPPLLPLLPIPFLFGSKVCLYINYRGSSVRILFFSLHFFIFIHFFRLFLSFFFFEHGDVSRRL